MNKDVTSISNETPEAFLKRKGTISTSAFASRFGWTLYKASMVLNRLEAKKKIRRLTKEATHSILNNDVLWETV